MMDGWDEEIAAAPAEAWPEAERAGLEAGWPDEPTGPSGELVAADWTDGSGDAEQPPSDAQAADDAGEWGSADAEPPVEGGEWAAALAAVTERPGDEDVPAEAGWQSFLPADGSALIEAGEDAGSGSIMLGARPDGDDLQGRLLAAMAEPGDVAFDASEVERIGMSSIQALLAASLDLSRRGDRLVAVNPSFAFGLAFEALGFTGEREAFTVEYR